MKGIRIEGFSVRLDSRIAITVSTKYILCVLDTYEFLLPCSQIENTEQYYVIFDDPIASYSAITTFDSSKKQQNIPDHNIYHIRSLHFWYCHSVSCNP